MAEAIDRRYLAAFKCVDRATGFHLTRAMKIEAQQLRFFRNHSSIYVIQEAPGLEQYTGAFEPVPGDEDVLLVIGKRYDGQPKIKRIVCPAKGSNIR